MGKYFNFFTFSYGVLPYYIIYPPSIFMNFLSLVCWAQVVHEIRRAPIKCNFYKYMIVKSVCDLLYFVVAMFRLGTLQNYQLNLVQTFENLFFSRYSTSTLLYCSVSMIAIASLDSYAYQVGGRKLKWLLKTRTFVLVIFLTIMLSIFWHTYIFSEFQIVYTNISSDAGYVYDAHTSGWIKMSWNFALAEQVFLEIIIALGAVPLCALQLYKLSKKKQPEFIVPSYQELSTASTNSTRNSVISLDSASSVAPTSTPDLNQAAAIPKEESIKNCLLALTLGLGYITFTLVDFISAIMISTNLIHLEYSNILRNLTLEYVASPIAGVFFGISIWFYAVFNKHFRHWLVKDLKFIFYPFWCLAVRYKRN